MKPFTPNKVLRRVVKIRSSDRAIADADWVLALGVDGVRIRRLGAGKAGELYLSWRSVVGHALIHHSTRR